MISFACILENFCGKKVLGKYIVDFYCAKAKLVIELDGSQHYTEQGMKNDEIRTEFLSQYGLVVLRIPNENINNNFNGVCEYLDEYIESRIAQLQ